MNRNKVCILSTASLEQSLIEKVTAQGIDIDIQPFIAINERSFDELNGQIKPLFSKSKTVVFTSANAVNSVARFKDDFNPDWRIYCMGKATKRAVTNLFGANWVAGCAHHAAELAELIIKTGIIKDVVFFCGNIRRNELPDKLIEAGIGIEEVIVYNTLGIDCRLDKDYDAILFFSPSAVNNFFLKNDVSSNTVLYAIGQVTANEIKLYTENKIIVNSEPDKEQMLQQVVAAFQNDTIIQ